MENNKKATKNTLSSQGVNGDEEWAGGSLCLPNSKDLWRRVFNENLKCYEIYVRNTNILVATGIGNTGDSFLIGALPAIMTTFIQLTKQIENGEVSEETYRNALNLIYGFKQNIRKGENVDRGGLFGLNSIELDLEGQGGGSYKEARLYD
jgi:hypothetical protein